MSTYREAGVDLASADALVGRIEAAVTNTWSDQVRGGFGGFAAGVILPEGYRTPVLMMSTDGVGTKAELARQTGLIDGLGFDLVAMCVDDLAAAGAKPLAFTDYIATGQLDVERMTRLVESIAAACLAADAALLGGETAEHPGVMEPDAFDLAGAALGVVEAGDEITGDSVAAGDVVIGVASPNVRSNGFSLIRSAVLTKRPLDSMVLDDSVTLGEALLAPSVIYSPAIQSVLAVAEVHAMAHVTGGGIAGNLVRVLPADLAATVDIGTWPRPPIFDLILDVGEIAVREAFAAFNMGLGFLVVAPPSEATSIRDALATAGHDSYVVGKVVEGDREVSIEH
ncbi:MAG: phosphoribosylformylglycinamidine cyclo-ligase [Acidimicrobiia bacterium]|nr:phosphoribosylformylglycinamidine cyclo-ligase [Acidimicrobiia bacterium]